MSKQFIPRETRGVGVSLSGAFGLPRRARWAGCAASQKRRSGAKTQRRCRCARQAWSGIGHSLTTQWPEHPVGRRLRCDQRRGPGPHAGSTGCSGCCHQTAGLDANKRAEDWKLRWYLTTYNARSLKQPRKLCARHLDPLVHPLLVWSIISHILL